MCPKVACISFHMVFSAISGWILKPFDLQVATMCGFDIMYDKPALPSKAPQRSVVKILLLNAFSSQFASIFIWRNRRRSVCATLQLHLTSICLNVALNQQILITFDEYLSSFTMGGS